MILILSENAAGKKSSREFFSRLSKIYKDVRPSEQTTRYLKPLVEADLVRKQGKGEGRSSGYVLSIVSESLYDISRLYLLVSKSDPGKVREFMKSEFYMESLSRYIGSMDDAFDFRRPLDFRLFLRLKPGRTGLLLDDYALANPILVKPDDTTNLSNFSARIGRMPEGGRFPNLAVDVSNRDMLYLHADPFKDERKCEILDRYDYRQCLSPEIYNYINEQASWKDAVGELAIIEGMLLAKDRGFNEFEAGGSEGTGKMKVLPADLLSTIEAGKIEDGKYANEEVEQDKRRTLFLERISKSYPDMPYYNLVFRPEHETSAFRYIAQVLQTSISVCDFLYSAIIDSVKIEITSQAVPCTMLIFDEEVTRHRGPSWLPLIAHVLRNDPMIKVNEEEEKIMIVSGNAFLEEIQSLDDSSALKVIFNESTSRSAIMQGHDTKKLEGNFYDKSMMNHSLTLGEIALISVFHAPRPEFIELAGANMDIGISQEDLYFLKDNGVKIADLLE